MKILIFLFCLLCSYLAWSDTPPPMKVGVYGQYLVTAPTLTASATSLLMLDVNGNLETSDSKLNSITTAPVSSSSAIVITQKPSNRFTYSSSVTGLVAANTATDIFTISGSASKTIRVIRFAITGTQTTAAQRDILLVKRSTANTGGTSVAQTAVAHDSLNTSATAVVRSYTANPTALGSLAGNIRTRKVYLGTATGNSDEVVLEFGTRNNQEIVLRGTGETASINLNGVTSNGNSFDISVEWVEE